MTPRGPRYRGPVSPSAPERPQTLTDAPAAPAARRRPLDRLAPATRGVAIANLVAQLVIVVTGGLVRLTGSGLGCSDWPQCQPGHFTPVPHAATGYHQWVEFGNRLVTIGVVVVAIALAVLVWSRRDRVRSVRVLGLVPVIGVVVQAVVGGLSVLFDLAPALVGFHLLLSMSLVALSTLLVVRLGEGDAPAGRLVDPVTWRLTRVLGAWLVPVLVLGVLVTGSGPHAGDDNDVTQRFGFDPEVITRAHSSVVWVFVLLLAVTIWRAWRFPTPQRSRRSLLVLLAATLLQGVIGYTQYFLALPIGLVALHMVGAGVLTTATTWMLLAMRTRSADLPATR